MPLYARTSNQLYLPITKIKNHCKITDLFLVANSDSSVFNCDAQCDFLVKDFDVSLKTRLVLSAFLLFVNVRFNLSYYSISFLIPFVLNIDYLLISRSAKR